MDLTSSAITPSTLSVNSFFGIIYSFCFKVTVPAWLKVRLISLYSIIFNFALTTKPLAKVPVISYVPTLSLSTLVKSQVIFDLPSVPSLYSATTLSGKLSLP